MSDTQEKRLIRFLVRKLSSADDSYLDRLILGQGCNILHRSCVDFSRECLSATIACSLAAAAATQEKETRERQRQAKESAKLELSQ